MTWPPEAPTALATVADAVRWFLGHMLAPEPEGPSKHQRVNDVTLKGHAETTSPLAPHMQRNEIPYAFRILIPPSLK